MLMTVTITNEDTAINISAASGVLSNDTDIDTSDVLHSSSVDLDTTTVPLGSPSP